MNNTFSYSSCQMNVQNMFAITKKNIGIQFNFLIYFAYIRYDLIPDGMVQNF